MVYVLRTLERMTKMKNKIKVEPKIKKFNIKVELEKKNNIHDIYRYEGNLLIPLDPDLLSALYDISLITARDGKRFLYYKNHEISIDKEAKHIDQKLILGLINDWVREDENYKTKETIQEALGI